MSAIHKISLIGLNIMSIEHSQTDHNLEIRLSFRFHFRTDCIYYMDM